MTNSDFNRALREALAAQEREMSDYWISRKEIINRRDIEAVTTLFATRVLIELLNNGHSTDISWRDDKGRGFFGDIGYLYEGLESIEECCIRRLRGEGVTDDEHNSQREDIHGAWLVHGEAPWFVRECSECHTKWFFTNGDPVAKYCSECGACMDKPQIFCEDYGTKGDI